MAFPNRGVFYLAPFVGIPLGNTMSDEIALNWKGSAPGHVRAKNPAATIALAVMFMGMSLIGVVPFAEAAAGDFFVVPGNDRAGATSTYTVTYRSGGALSGDSNEPVLFTTSFPGTSEQFVLENVKHEYPTSTHSWRIYNSGTGGDNDPVLTKVEFAINRSVASNEKITYTVEVRNPFDAGDYTVRAAIQDQPSGLLASPTEFTSAKTLTIRLGAPGGTGVLLDMPGLAGQPSDVAGTLLLTPASNTHSVQLTLPFAFDVEEDELASGWTGTVKVDDPDDDSNDRSATMKYTGSALQPGQASEIPLSGIVVTDHVGTFTFTSLERDSSNSQVRSNTFTFEVTPNIMPVEYVSASHSTQFAAMEHTLRFTATLPNGLDAADSDNAGHAFVVVFPAGFDLSGVTANDVDLESGSRVLAGSSTTIDAGARTITFTMGTSDSVAPDATVRIFMRNAVTPPNLGATGPFDFYSLNEDGIKVDQVVASDAPGFTVVKRGSLTETNLTAGTIPAPTTEGRAGQPGALEFAFEVETADPSAVRFYFPATFNLSGETGLVASVTVGDDTLTNTPVFDSDTRALEIDLSAFTIPDDTEVAGNLTGFRFPVITGSQSVTLRTVGASGGEMDDGSGSFEIVSTPLGTFKVEREEDGLGATGAFTFVFDPQGLLLEDGEMVIGFTGEYDLSGVKNNTATSVTLKGVALAPANVTIGTNAVTVTVPEEALDESGNTTLIIDGIKNPKIRPSTVDGGKVSLSLRFNGSVVATTTAVQLDPLVIPADAPLAYHLTPDSIAAANRLIKTTAKETKEGDIMLDWILPSNAPRVDGSVVPPVGVQVWHSASPYTLVQTFEADDDGFDGGNHLHEDGTVNDVYLVTMFYEDDIGKFTGDDAPDTTDYPGTTVQQDTGWTWQWALIGVGALLVIGLLAFVIVRSTRR